MVGNHAKASHDPCKCLCSVCNLINNNINNPSSLLSCNISNKFSYFQNVTLAEILATEMVLPSLRVLFACWGRMIVLIYQVSNLQKAKMSAVELENGS